MQTKVGWGTWTATPNVTYYNVGFRPKAIYFLANHDTGNTEDITTFELSFGMTDCTDQVVFLQRLEQDFTLPNAVKYARSYHKNNYVMGLLDANRNEEALASLLSIDDTGFTISFSQVTGTPHRFAYFVIGGDNVETKLSSFLTTTGGIQQSVNMGFMPNYILHINDSLEDIHAPSEEKNLSFMASSGLKYSTYPQPGFPNGQLWGFIANQYTPTYPTATSLYASWVYSYRGSGGQIEQVKNKLPNGLVYQDIGGPAGFRIYYLAIKVNGMVTDPTSYDNPFLWWSNVAGTQAQAYTFHDQGKGGIFIGNNAHTNSTESDYSISIGFFDNDMNQAVFYAYGGHYIPSFPYYARHGQDDTHFAITYRRNPISPYLPQKMRTAKVTGWYNAWNGPDYWHGVQINTDYLIGGLTGNYGYIWQIFSEPATGQMVGQGSMVV